MKVINVPSNVRKLAIHIAAGAVGAAVFYAVQALGGDPLVSTNPEIAALFGFISGDILRVTTFELRKVDPNVQLPTTTSTPTEVPTNG